MSDGDWVRRLFDTAARGDEREFHAYVEKMRADTKSRKAELDAVLAFLEAVQESAAEAGHGKTAATICKVLSHGLKSGWHKKGRDEWGINWGVKK